MPSLLFSIIISAAQADIAPPPKCPNGTHLVGRTECVKDGHVRIHLFDVIPWKSSLQPQTVGKQIKSGEMVIPGLSLAGITIEKGTLELKEEDEERVEKLLKDFFQSYHLKAESKKEAQLAKEKEKAALAAKNEGKSCSNLSISQSLILVFFGFGFSNLRRRA